MKSSNVKPPAGAAAADGSVAEALAAIDTSVLDALLETHREELRIREFRERATAMKDAVDPLVWQRVVGDYASRLAAVEAKARPLKARGRQEYARLRVLIDRVSKEQYAAGIAKAELEFRHAVGELDENELAERMKEPAAVLARCDEELTAINGLKERFVEAFGSEAELEAPAGTAEPAAPPAAASASGDDSTGAMEPVDATIIGQPVPEPTDAVNAAGTAVPAPETADATVLVDASEIPADATVIAPMPPADEVDATVLHAAAPAPQAAAGAEEHTFLLPSAALLIEMDGSVQEYRLAAVNYLGRSDDNHLQIARPGVSRRHAVIMAAASGFVIQDLGSQNGVFVNGERVGEHTLKDGEQIVIGDSTLTFRSPWPQKTRPDGAQTRTAKA